jgi:hypothetical protein
MVAGLALATTIRPHVAAVLAVSTCLAEWTTRGWTTRRMAQSAVASVLAVWFFSSALGQLGLAQADLGSLRAFMTRTGELTNQGGSAFVPADNIATAIPMAFVNVLFRPFITEVSSGMALLTSLELIGFWALVCWFINNLRPMMRSWQANRFLRFGMFFAGLYILMIGVTFQNFGIIARQRTLVMPAVLLVLAAPVVAAPRRLHLVASRRVWHRPAERSAHAPTAVAQAFRPAHRKQG